MKQNDMRFMRYLGIDIGGTKCAVILGNTGDEEHGGIQISDKIVFPTDKVNGFTGTLENIFECLDQILSRNSIDNKHISAIGISCGGPLDSEKGIILSPPNLPGWNNIEITEIIESKTGINTYLENDANACAIAEWKYGAGKGFDNIIFLTFGTGIGAGLILNGRLYKGANDMAGEVGHIRLAQFGPVGYGKSGSFEGFCSGNGIAQLASLKAYEKLQMGENTAFCSSIEELPGMNAKNVGMAAKTGDETASLVYRLSGHYLGMGLSILIDIINPEMIIIGGIYMRDYGLLGDEMRKSLEEETLKRSLNACRIVPAALSENIGDYGALSVAVFGGRYE